MFLRTELGRVKHELAELKARDQTNTATTPNPNPRSEIKIYDYITVKSNRVSYFGPTCWRTFVGRNTNNSEVAEEAVAYLSNVRREWQIKMNHKYNLPNIYDDLTSPSSDALLLSLCRYLPDYDVVKEYINTYRFSFWTHFLPIMDVHVLLHDFLKLFAKDEHTNKCVISIREKSVDYARISLIVVVIKYVVLTINLTREVDEFPDRGELVQYAQELLRFSKSEYRATLPALQTMILMHSLLLIDPMNGDGGDGSTGAMLFKAAVNMAITMGLHRNVDDLYQAETTVFRNTLRQIWKVLYIKDAYLSIYVGLPLTIDESCVNMKSFGKLEEDDEKALQLFKCMREFCRIVNRAGPIYKDEILRMISVFEQFGDGELLRLSMALEPWNSLEGLLGNISRVPNLIHKLFGLHVLHVMWDLLLENVDDNDPDYELYTFSTKKFASLYFAYVIEFLVKLNDLCTRISYIGDHLDTCRLAEVSIAVVASSKIPIYRSYVTFFACEMKLIDSESTSENEFQMTVQDLEDLKLGDGTDIMTRGFMSRGFAHNFMATGCKLLLYIRQTSFMRVFSLNFSTYCLLAGYKFFDSVVTKQRRALQQSTEQQLANIDAPYTRSMQTMVFPTIRPLGVSTSNNRTDMIQEETATHEPDLFQLQDDGVDALFSSLLETDDPLDRLQLK
jgi:hypothetical protein